MFLFIFFYKAYENWLSTQKIYGWDIDFASGTFENWLLSIKTKQIYWTTWPFLWLSCALKHISTLWWILHFKLQLVSPSHIAKYYYFEVLEHL